MPEGVSVRAVAFDGPEAAALLAELREGLTAVYGAPGIDPDPADFGPPGGRFLLVEVDGRPAGCGGVRRLDADTAEVNRMVVTAGTRRRGVGRLLLANLEVAARELGYRALRLETGSALHAAIALYEGAGFRPVPCWGAFAARDFSRCYEKPL